MTVSKKKTAKILVVAFVMFVGYIYNEDSNMLSSRFLSSEETNYNEETSSPKSCDGWCLPHADPWDMKCTYKHCNGCSQCFELEDQKVEEQEEEEVSSSGQEINDSSNEGKPKSCDGWCLPHLDPWDMKCTFNHCNGCSECFDQEGDKKDENLDEEQEKKKEEDSKDTMKQEEEEKEDDRKEDEGSSRSINDPVYLQKLWFGENIRVENIPKDKPNKVDLVVTYCHAEDFESFIEYFEKMLPEYVTIIHLKLMSKCNKENVLVEHLKEKLIGLPRWHFSIYPLVNKGGCDLGVARYIVDFLQVHPVMDTDDSNKVVMFLKDGPRSPQNFHVNFAHYRSLENMFEISSQGRFVCGSQINDSRSPYHDVNTLKSFMMTEYKRFNSAVGASGIEFTHGYKNLGHFVDLDLNWTWPNSSYVEVCYGGTFAFHASNMYNNEYLLEDLTKVIRILEEGGDLSVVEHFMERLWAALISKPLNEEEVEAISNMPGKRVEYNRVTPGILIAPLSRSYRKHI